MDGSGGGGTLKQEKQFPIGCCSLAQCQDNSGCYSCRSCKFLTCTVVTSVQHKESEMSNSAG